NRDTLPTEEEQYQAYRQIAEALKPHPVTIRTFDLGGDKFLSHLQVPTEMNPFLGWRAIRFCLQEKEVFRSQLRAILRASAHGNIRMMYDDFGAGRIEPGECAGGRIQGRVAQRKFAV